MATVTTRHNRRAFPVRTLATYLTLLFGAVLSLFPFYWMVAGSLKPRHVLGRWPPDLIPPAVTLDGYRYLWDAIDVPRAFLNSVIVAMLHVGLNIFFSGLVAYALAKMRVPGRRFFIWLVLALAMVPFQIMLIPLFLEIDRLGLLNTYAGIVLPGAVSSFSIFLLYQAFKSIPNDYIDAALLDGAGHFGILMRIVTPMSWPLILTASLINFYFSWNGFLWPWLVATNQKIMTLPVALAVFNGTVGSNPRWDAILAGASVTTLPIVVLYLFIQRKFIESLSMTGLKG